MKSILTLLFTVAICAVMNAQTSNTEQQATPTQVEPTKKIAYEVVPAKRVVKPTSETPSEMQPMDISEIEKRQKEEQVQKKVEQRNATQGAQQQAAPMNQPVYDLKDEKPKE